MKRGWRHILRKRKHTSFLRYWLLLVVTLSFLIVTGCGQDGDAPTSTTPAPTPTPTGTPIEPTPATKPVDIVIYLDFQCDGCESLHSNVEGELERLYVDTGLAILDVRPLAHIGPESMRAAEAALCAADQGKFREYQDAIFALWLEKGSAAYSAEELASVADILGIDVEAFGICLESGAKQAEVRANKDAAINSGVTGVPAVVIDGTIMEGNQTLQVYVDIIEQVLAK